MPATNGNVATHFENLYRPQVTRPCQAAGPVLNDLEPRQVLCAIQEEADYQHHS